MEPDDRHSMLWQLSEALSEESRDGESVRPDLDPIEDAVLLAYARGELSTTEGEKVEKRLMDDDACRRRLSALRGVDMPPAPAKIRQHLIDRFATPKLPSHGAQPTGRTRPYRAKPFWGAVAALLLAALGSVFLWRPQTPPVAMPTYEVSLQGLSERRSPGTGGGSGSLEKAPEASAYAETSIEIHALATGPAVDGLEISLFGHREGRLRRLEGAIDRVERQGAIRFVANASELVGSVPGSYEIFVVIGPAPLPARLPDGLSRQVLRSDDVSILDSGFQIHRLLLRLQKPDPPPEIGGPTPDD